MTAIDWILFAQIVVLALGVRWYRAEWKRADDICLELRQALLDAKRSADEREQLAVRAMEDVFRRGKEVGAGLSFASVEIETACDCPRCRAQKWATN